MKKELERCKKTIVMKYIEMNEELDYLRKELKEVYYSEAAKDEVCMEISIARSKVCILADIISDLEIDIAEFA